MNRLLVCTALFPALAMATPQTLRHQGRLVDGVGTAIEGQKTLVLSIYTDPITGPAVWSEQDTVDLAGGYYATTLGDTTPLSTLDFAANTYWLGVGVLNETEFTPRTQLQAVPVALTALDGVWDQTGADIGYTGGSVGVGTASPAASAALEVSSTSGGFLPPRMTTSERNAVASPVDGLVIFNTSVRELQVFAGGHWSGLGVTDDTAGNPPGIVGWGYNLTGNLAVGTTTTMTSPLKANTTGVDISQLSTGGYIHGNEGASCVRTTTNDLWCVGSGRFIPNGSGTNLSTFQERGAPYDYDWVNISVGSGLVACGVVNNSVTSQNDAYCWGYQHYGGLGNGVNSTSYVYTPTLVIDGIDWKTMEPGGRHSTNHRAFLCGISNDTGAANGYCWGNDSWGQLGNGAGGENYVDPSAGLIPNFEWDVLHPRYLRTCGITVGGDGYCWGYGALGRLGNGSTADRQTPTAISGGYKWTDIAMGWDHTCGLRTDGVLMCWGDNPYGQLGTGNTTDQYEPMEVLGGKRWTQVAAGKHHTCAVDTVGRAYCWGHNSNGSVGDGTASHRYAPVPVYTDERFSDIQCGAYSSMGLTR